MIKDILIRSGKFMLFLIVMTNMMFTGVGIMSLGCNMIFNLIYLGSVIVTILTIGYIQVKEAKGEEAFDI